MSAQAIDPTGSSFESRNNPSPLPIRRIVGLGLLACAAVLPFMAIDALTLPVKLTLAVFIATIVAWTLLDLPDTPVALAGAAGLAISGVVAEDVLYEALGSEILWLMLSAFIVAAALRQVGAIEQVIGRLLSRVGSVRSLFWVLTLLIFATAFIIPSTSARAAMLAPVYLGLSAAIGNARVSRALALLFPSVILLSAGASLTGAGAHLVAADMMARLDGERPGFIAWLLLAGPFALLSSLLACAILLRFFLNAEERDLAIVTSASQSRQPMTRRQLTVLAVTAAMVIMFATQPLHGIGMALVGIVAALAVTCKPVSGLSLKAALKGVEWNLLLFLAGTLVIGEALLETGTAAMLADGVVGLFGDAREPWPVVVIAFAVLVATLSHLVITSRTARATVLIPALALPLASLGVNPASLIMVTTLASGFCQTLMVSAKPVALFGAMDDPPFGQRDLLRLAALLIVPFMGLLVAFAALAWPLQGVPLG